MWLQPFLKDVDVDSQGVVQQDSSLNLYVENSGFSSMVMVKNLGSTLIYLGIYLTMVFFYLVFSMSGIFF